MKKVLIVGNSLSDSMKKVLIVGNCRSDYIDLSGLIEINFKAKCTPALSIHEAKKNP
jgi:hypothetical protein